MTDKVVMITTRVCGKSICGASEQVYDRLINCNDETCLELSKIISFFFCLMNLCKSGRVYVHTCLYRFSYAGHHVACVAGTIKLTKINNKSLTVIL